MRNKTKKEKAMIMQAVLRMEAVKLSNRREALRRKLKKHFSSPIEMRNYGEFEKVVDELDALRRRLHVIRNGVQ